MKGRPAKAPKSAYLPLALLLPLLIPVLGVAQGQRPVPPPPSAARSGPSGANGPGGPGVGFEGRELAVPTVLAAAGPLFALQPLVAALGGELAPGETGESMSLKLGDREVVIGVGSSVITVGDTIVSLSQPPTRGEGGLLVPVDFLNKTYGDLQGYAFEWRPEQQRLVISRQGARELPVALDVVHLQGMTTVVLQFPSPPRYRLDQRPGTVQVQMTADRLSVPTPPKRVEDPLVRGVEITPQAVRLDLMPGAEVESYVLDNPFRIVFDVHERSALTQPAGPAYAPSERGVGVRTIVIDPGHGGVETGAVGPSGVLEKTLTLQLAQALAGRLQQSLGVRTVLTRSEDALLPLDTRPAIANQNKADLFVSIHLNSSLGSGAHGAETYFLSTQASDARAASAASAENAGRGSADLGAGAEQSSLQLMLWDLAQSHHLSESQRFATLVQGELNEALQLKDRGVKQAPFRVLMGADMPAVLVELGFISNPDEEAKLQDPAYRAALVDALVRAIGRYKEQVEAPPVPAALPGGASTQPAIPAPGASPAPAAPRASPP